MSNNKAGDPLFPSKHAQSAQISAILLKLGKVLTNLLRDEKALALEHFATWYSKQDPAPTRLTTELAFYKDYINNRNFCHLVNSFISNVRNDADKRLMESTSGRDKIAKSIKQKIWKHIKGKFCRARELKPSNEDLAANTDSESEEYATPPASPPSSPEVLLTNRKRQRNDVIVLVPNKRCKPAHHSGLQSPRANDPRVTPSDDELVLIQDDQTNGFAFNVQQLSDMSLTASDMQFTWQAVSQGTYMVLMSIAQSNMPATLLKCFFMLTSSVRYELLSGVRSDHNYSTIAAPLLDHNVRLYTLLIDLSLATNVLITPSQCERKFKIFFFCLVHYAHDRAGHFESFWQQLQVFGIQDRLSKRELFAFVAHLRTGELQLNCLEAVQYMAAMTDCRDLASFTLSNHLSGWLEARQRSSNDYETVLLHLITNCLLRSKANTTYQQTQLLFKAIFCNEENSLTSTATFKKVIARAREHCAEELQ